MGDRFFLAILVALFWLGIAVAACGGAVLARWVPEPAATPRMWVAPSPFDAACVLYADNPCLLVQWPKETP